MDSSSFSAIVEALTRLFNPELEKKRAKDQLEQDLGTLEALLRLGLRPETIEYRDGRLNFKMALPEAFDAQSIDVISLDNLEGIPLSGDNGKLKLEPPQKKYE